MIEKINDTAWFAAPLCPKGQVRPFSVFAPLVLHKKSPVLVLLQGQDVYIRLAVPPCLSADADPFSEANTSFLCNGSFRRILLTGLSGCSLRPPESIPSTLCRSALSPRSSLCTDTVEVLFSFIGLLKGIINLCLCFCQLKDIAKSCRNNRSRENSPQKDGLFWERV